MQFAGDVRIQRSWHCQVIEPGQAGALAGVEVLQATRQGLIGVSLGVIDCMVEDQAQECFDLGRRLSGQSFGQMSPERLVRKRLSAAAKNSGLLGQQAALIQRQQRGEQFASGQVAGRSENHHLERPWVLFNAERFLPFNTVVLLHSNVIPSLDFGLVVYLPVGSKTPSLRIR